MNTPLRIAAALVAALVVAPAAAQVGMSRSDGRFTFGGGLGLGATDVTYITVSPYLAYRITDELDIGASLSYRYRNDNRFSRDLATHDVGSSVFTRYHLPGPLFVQAELEYMSYEVYRADFSKERRGVTSVLAGGGFSQPIGSNASAHLVLMYNFSYSGYGQPAPYSSPWVLRAGVGVHF